jgi:hypothetical protein
MLGTEFSRRLDGVFIVYFLRNNIQIWNSIQIYILLFDYASIFRENLLKPSYKYANTCLFLNKICRMAFFYFLYSSRWTSKYKTTTFIPCVGAQVNQPVCTFYYIHIMFYDNNGVSLLN